jgi:hypothetical protein
VKTCRIAETKKIRSNPKTQNTEQANGTKIRGLTTISKKLSKFR